MSSVWSKYPVWSKNQKHLRLVCNPPTGLRAGSLGRGHWVLRLPALVWPLFFWCKFQLLVEPVGAGSAPVAVNGAVLIRKLARMDF